MSQKSKLIQNLLQVKKIQTFSRIKIQRKQQTNNLILQRLEQKNAEYANLSAKNLIQEENSSKLKSKIKELEKQLKNQNQQLSAKNESLLKKVEEQKV